VLIAGRQVRPGRTQGGGLNRLPGAPGGVAWVWSALIEWKARSMVEPPPTPTPQTTPTSIQPWHLGSSSRSTNAPADLQHRRRWLSTFPQPSPGTTAGADGLVIVGMGVIGLFGMVISFLRGGRIIRN
jgi:hypothetical protein